MAAPKRTSIPVDVRQLVLHECGFRCGNPNCRFPVTLEIHHLDPVAIGGGNGAHNLLCLCPNCHTLHHGGTIPIESLRAWKHLLLSLNEAFDRRAVDVLLSIHQMGDLSVMADGLLHCAGLLTSGLVDVRMRVNGPATGMGADILKLGLSAKGKVFVEGWLAGNQELAIGGNAT